VNQPSNATQPWYVDQSGRRYIAIGSIGRVKCLMFCDGSDRVMRAISSSVLLRLLYALAILPGLITALGIPMFPIVAAKQFSDSATIHTAALIVVLAVYAALAVRIIAAVRDWARSSVVLLEWIAALIGTALWSAGAFVLWLSPASL
jgi:hypothetical protein